MIRREIERKQSVGGVFIYRYLMVENNPTISLSIFRFIHLKWVFQLSFVINRGRIWLMLDQMLTTRTKAIVVSNDATLFP